MHGSVLDWAARVVAQHHLASMSVLEVGSLDVNGTVRGLFSGPYLGCDIRPGPGVEVVVEPGGPLPDGPWPVIVSTEMLEHDEQPWVTLRRMHDVAAHDALLLLTCRGIGFPLHEHPGDHWRFSTTGLGHLLRFCGWEPLDLADDPGAEGVLALAQRREV